jgi:hypothetical protein
VYQGITTEIGKTYKISLHYDRGTVDGRIVVRNDSTNTVSGALFYEDLGTGADGKTYWNTFTATATTTYILLYAKNTSGGTSAYDEVSVTLEKDRSANNKGLNVLGTVTKSPVATGAELVAYSGFTNSNYLKQPYNSDLDFGTGDYYFTYWMNSPSISSDQSIFQQGDYSQDKGINTLVWNSSGSGNSLQVGDGSANIVVEGHENAGWIQIFAVRKNGRLSVYKNGILQGTAGSSRNINYSSSSHNKSLVIGAMYSNGSLGFPYSGDLALFRVGASAPSAEQVKKIYEDEKHLFQENAKATLYGSSNAVTGLAHDDSTDSLHVGTSAGRSEFQGLRRINNTTEAVTTAISASNGLVAEQ